MSAQTYCTIADLEAAWTAAAVLASVDDDSSGALSATELGYLDRAIERGATRMNAALELRYRLSDLAQNAWCRDCNVALTLYLLACRRGAAADDWLVEQYEAFLAALEAIAAGRLKVPQAPESFDHGPSATNFTVDLLAPPAAGKPRAAH